MSQGCSLYSKKVLLIDGDPQGHTSLTFGVDADDLQTTLGAYLTSHWTAKQAADYFINVNSYLDVVPSNQSLSDFIISVSAEETKIRNKHLKNFVDPIKKDYDYIIFDMVSKGVDCPRLLLVVQRNTLHQPDQV